MTMDIRRITFEDVYPIWSNYLWPNRESKIETHSAMLFNNHPYRYDGTCFEQEAIFLGAYVDNELAGVNSGHLVGNNTFRSRGLYVYDRFRGHSIGKALLQATIDCSIEKSAEFCWSLPRKSAINTYTSAGFKLVGNWIETETSDSNIFVHT